MAKDDKKKNVKDEDQEESAGKKNKKKGKGEAGEPSPYSSIATHPKARASVKRLRAWTGLAAFIAAAVLSVKAQVPIDQAGMRALAAGIAGYMLAWWASMKVWRHLMIAEQRAAYEEMKRRREERAERNRQAAARG